MISLNEQIFVCGGRNDSGVLNSVEKYSIETDTWQFVSPMNFCRHSFSIVTLGKHLFVIGGDSGDSLNRVNILLIFYYYFDLVCKTRLI